MNAFWVFSGKTRRTRTRRKCLIRVLVMTLKLWGCECLTLICTVYRVSLGFQETKETGGVKEKRYGVTHVTYRLRDHSQALEWMKHINTQQSYRISASGAEVTVGCKSLHPHGFRGGKMKMYFVFFFRFCKNVNQKKYTGNQLFFYIYTSMLQKFFFQFIII